MSDVTYNYNGEIILVDTAVHLGTEPIEDRLGEDLSSPLEAHVRFVFVPALVPWDAIDSLDIEEITGTLTFDSTQCMAAAYDLRQRMIDQVPTADRYLMLTITPE